LESEEASIVLRCLVSSILLSTSQIFLSFSAAIIYFVLLSLIFNPTLFSFSISPFMGCATNGLFTASSHLENLRMSYVAQSRLKPPRRVVTSFLTSTPLSIGLVYICCILFSFVFGAKWFRSGSNAPVNSITMDASSAILRHSKKTESHPRFF
jgi:hypothetical protein